MLTMKGNGCARWLSFSNPSLLQFVIHIWSLFGWSSLRLSRCGMHTFSSIKFPCMEILQCYEIKFIFYSFYTSSCFLDIFRSQNRRVGSLEAVSSARGLSQMRTLLQERLHPIAEWQLFMIVMRNETCFRKEFHKWVSYLCTVNFFFIIFVMLALTVETVGDGEST